MIKTKVFISNDKRMICTLVLILNKDTKVYEGYVRYNNIYTDIVDFNYSEADYNNSNELYDKAFEYCTSINAIIL